MSSPQRWLLSSDAPSGAQQLLASAPEPPAFSEEVRYRLAIGIAKTASLPIAAAAWSALIAKGALVAAAATGGGLVVHVASRAPQAPMGAAPVSVVRAPAVSLSPSVALPQALPPELALPALEKAPQLRLDPRVAEAELLEKARALVATNPASALKLATQHGREFPSGRLGAEADLIVAQSLLGLGKTDAARQRAEASLRRYPNGIYAPKLRQIAGR